MELDTTLVDDAYTTTDFVKDLATETVKSTLSTIAGTALAFGVLVGVGFIVKKVEDRKLAKQAAESPIEEPSDS